MNNTIQKRVFNVSILLCTYNCSYKTLLRTLDSIIEQKNVNMQIVISDDASTNNHFDEIKNFFKKKHFSNFKLISNNHNVGTVCNFLRGAEECSFDIIKGFGQGDCFVDNLSLFNWINKFVLSGRKWSFCKAKYFQIINDKFVFLKMPSNPNNLNCYRNDNLFLIKFNYLINDDKVLGAATLCYRTELIKYLKIIQNEIILCEDYIYRLMMFDNQVCYFYDEYAILYERGNGVTSSKNLNVLRVLNNDYNGFKKLLKFHNCVTIFQFFTCLFYKLPFIRKAYIKIIRILFC